MARAHEERQWLIIAIGVFKLVKSALLIAAGLAAIHELRGDAADLIMQLANWAHVDPQGHVIQRLISRLGLLSEKQLEAVAVGTWIYAAVFLVEGGGLLARKRWAEWLTVIVTGSFIPLEVWHLVREPGASKVVTIAVNLAVVVYLIVRIVRRRREERPRGERARSGSLVHASAQ